MSGTAAKAGQRATPSSSSRRYSGSSQASAGKAGPKVSDSQPLLTPVVRSKRTPIACTECRRRQVKCTGGSPQCERCLKRGVKCEYIPCNQQKAASTGSPTPPAQPERQMHHPIAFYQSQSSQSSTTPWQQSGSSYPDYFHDGRTSFEQRNDWRHQANGPIATEGQVSQSYLNVIPDQPRTSDVVFSRDTYSQATYSYQTYGQPGFQTTLPSHQSYTDGSFPSGYVTSDAHLGSGDQPLPFGYGGGPGRTSLLDQHSSHRSSFSGQYMQGGNALYTSPSVGLSSDFTNQDWTVHNLLRPYDFRSPPVPVTNDCPGTPCWSRWPQESFDTCWNSHTPLRGFYSSSVPTALEMSLDDGTNVENVLEGIHPSDSDPGSWESLRSFWKLSLLGNNDGTNSRLVKYGFSKQRWQRYRRFSRSRAYKAGLNWGFTAYNHGESFANRERCTNSALIA
ncbi:hypothetical protein BC835DRAFT_1304692 [Cytidiella melzeri]|nr:hypothetical protein BC835DRAFT_1304692 [Cytidiella melzeri]